MKKLFKGPHISLGGYVHPRLSCLGSTNTILGQHYPMCHGFPT